MIAGAWLSVSPRVLGYADDGAALANALIVGAATVVLAGIRFAGANDLAVSWLNLVVGVAVVVLELVSASATMLESRVVR